MTWCFNTSLLLHISHCTTLIGLFMTLDLASHDTAQVTLIVSIDYTTTRNSITFLVASSACLRLAR